MVIKRPAKAPALEPPPSDLKLIEKMVRASLEINPSLRGDATTTTTAFLEKMRQEAMGKAAPEAPAPATATARGAAEPAAPDAGDTHQKMIALFMAESGERFRGERSSLRERIARLEAEEARLREAAAGEVVNLVQVLLRSGAGAATLHRALGKYEAVLAEMGVSSADVVRRAKG